MAAFIVLAWFGGCPPVDSAPIYWMTPVAITADTDVYTRGSLLYAFDESNTAQTLNGVPFAAGNSASSLGGGAITISGLGGPNNTAFGSGTGNPWNGLSAGYKNILKGATYGANAAAVGTITLNNLISGHQYAIQFWVNDNRSGATATRTEKITSTGGNTQTLAYNNTKAAGGVGQYVLGFFTANSASQSFTLTADASAQMNAIQVRDVSNIGFWNGQASGVWDGASLNFCQNIISDPLSPAGFDTVKAMVPMVYFADTYYNSGSPVTVTRNEVTIGAGGVSGARVNFVNSAVAYSVSSSDAVGIAGSEGLYVMGGGTVTLNGTHTYTGPTVLSAGTLNLNGSLASQVTVNNGTTLNLAGNSILYGGLLNYGSVTGPYSLAVGTTLVGAGNLPGAVTLLHGASVTLGNTAGSVATVAMGDLTIQGDITLNFDLGAANTPGGGVNDLIQVAGGFTNAGTVTVNFNFTAGMPAMGVPYTIISCSALDPAFNPASFVSTSIIPATFSVSGNNVQVTFTARSYDLVWQGDPASNTNWAVNTPGWTNRATGDPEVFNTLDNVWFDDTAPNLVVNLPGVVYPGAVVVSSDNNNYTFAGSGGVSGPAMLSKSGASTLTLLSSNTHTGGITIGANSGSVLALANTTLNALGRGPVTIGAGSSLQLSNANTSANTVTITNTFSGPGLFRLIFAANTTARNTYVPNVSNLTGTIELANAGATGDKWNVTGVVAPAAALVINNGSQLFVSAGNNRFASIYVSGTGNSENRGAIRISSATAVLAGDITLGDNTTIGFEAAGANITGNIASGTDTPKILTIGIANSSGAGTLSGVIGGGPGSIGLTKAGSGTTVLAGANTFSGPTTVSAGALNLANALALQNSTVTLGVANGLTFAPAAGSTFTLGGLSGSVGLALQNTSSGAIILSVGNNGSSTTFSGVLSGAGGLAKIGSGTLTLGAINTYAGATYINGGILQLGASSGISNAAPIIVGAAGIFDVSQVTGGFIVKAGQTLGGFGVVTGNVATVAGGIIAPGTGGTAGTLSLSNNLALTNAVLKFDFADTPEAGNGVNDLVVVNGTLTLSGTTVVQPKLLNGALAPGVYTLIAGITNVAAGDVSNLQLAMPIRQSATLAFVESATPGITNLVMTVGGSAASLVWAGINDLWDVATTLNWTNIGTSALDQFFNFDNVLFEDTLSGSTNVSLASTINPASVLVNNSTINYTFTGLGGIAGLTGLTKDGSGTLTLSNALNSYSGPTIVKAGKLAIGQLAAEPVASPIIVSNGAVLDLNVYSTGALTWPNTNTLTGSGTVRVNTGSGANNIYLINDMSGFTGILDLIPNPSGKINLGQMRASPAPSATIRAQSGATIFLNSGKNLYCNVELYGGTTGEAYGQLRIDNNTTNFGPVLLKANSTIGGAFSGQVGYILGVISDDGLGYGFTKQGAGTIVLGAANTFSGPTTVSGGVLNLAHALALQNSTVNLGVANGLTFAPAAGSTFTLGGLGGSANLLLQDTASAPVTLMVGNNQASTTYAGALSGSGSLTKIGTGTLTLSGANTAAGGTVLNAGSLFVNGSVAGPFVMAAGTTLGGSGTIAGPVAMPDGTTLIPGASPNAVGTLTINNSLSLSNRCVIEFQLGGTTTEGAGINDLIQVNGDLNLSGVTTVRVSFAQTPALNQPYALINYTGALNGDANNLTVISETRCTFALDLSQPNKVRLTVLQGPANLYWIGLNPNENWDTKVTANWDPGTGGEPDVFYPGDAVYFDDFAFTKSVNLVGLLQPTTVTVWNDEDYLFFGTGALIGGRLNKTGLGTLIFANDGTNSFANGTFITQGALQIGNGGTSGALPAGPITVDANGLLIFNRSDDRTESNPISGAGALVKDGTNILTLTGANSHTGGTRIKAGTLKVGNAQALGEFSQSIITVSNGATLDISDQLLWNYAQPIVLNGFGAGPGLGALTKSAPIMNGVNHIRSIVLGSDAAIGGVTNSRIDIGRGDWVYPAHSTIGNIHIDGQSNTLYLVGNIYLGILAGATNLTGLVVNTNTSVAPHCNNSFGDAVVTLAGGTLTPWGADHVFGNKLVINSGFINNQGFNNTYTGPIEINGPVQINTISGGNITFNGNLSSTGSVNKIGAYSMILGGDNSGFTGSYTNSESNTFFTNATAGSAAAQWVLNAGNLGNLTQGAVAISLGSLSGSGGQLGNNAPGSEVTFVIGALGLNDVFQGNIVDTLGGGGTTALEKVGPGTLVLSGNNTYSGNTLVSGGTLQYDGALTANGGIVTVAAGGRLSGNGTLNRPVDVQAGGTVSPGASIGILTISSELTLGGTTVMEIDKDGHTNDMVRGLTKVTYGGVLTVVNLGGTLEIGDSFKLFDSASYEGSFATLQLPSLPQGLVWDVSQLAVSGTISVVANHPPVAQNTNLSTSQNRPAFLDVNKLLALCSDPDNDPVSFVSVSPSTNGATVTYLNGVVTYTPVTDFVGADEFSFTVSDSSGGQAVGKVEVLVYPGNLPSLNIVSAGREGANFKFTFAGIPGRNYQVQRATAITGPWSTLATVPAAAGGLTTFVDTEPPAGPAYYRTVYVQP